jgi:uncharacterized protein (TIRG00374 family)
MTVMINNPWRRSLLLGIMIALGLLVLLFSQINLSQALQTFAQLDARQLLLPMLITMGCLPFRPWRWQMIFPPRTRPKFWSCFSVLYLGSMSNNFLPGRGGDVLRCFLVRREVSLAGASLVLATLGLEKILDGLALLVVVLFSFWFFSPQQWLGQLGVYSSFIFIGSLGVLLLLYYRSACFLALMRSMFRKVRLESLGEKMVGLFARFSEGLNILNSLQQIVKVIGLTILIWFGEAALIWSLAIALKISLSLPAAVVVSAVLGLGLMIPAAPGSIGTYEFFSVAALRLFGIESGRALALTLLMHTWSFVVVTGLGLAGLWISGINFSQLIRGRSYQKEG